MMPAEDQAIVLPCASVMVIMVLLNDALTCAMPDAMFLRSRLRTRVASLPILDPFAALASGMVARNGHRPLYLWVTSSCPRLAWPVPCACERWYGCADHELEGCAGAAALDS